MRGMKSQRSAPLPIACLRILIAEDNPVNQVVARGLLRKLGYDADVVVDGSEVLPALRALRYDVILMDCQMPGMDGYETAQAIREFERQRAAPFSGSPIQIIAMTAHAMAGDRDKCLAAGMDDYVSKPVRLEDLQVALERCLRAKADTNEAAQTTRQREGDSDNSAPEFSEEPLVDVERLRDVTDDDPDQMRRLANIYLTQAVPLLEELESAVRAGSGGEVARVAHKLLGASVSCGVLALARPLRGLERLGHDGDLSGANALFADVRDNFPRVQRFLGEFLETLPDE